MAQYAGKRGIRQWIGEAPSYPSTAVASGDGLAQGLNQIAEHEANDQSDQSVYCEVGYKFITEWCIHRTVAHDDGQWNWSSEKGLACDVADEKTEKSARYGENCLRHSCPISVA